MDPRHPEQAVSRLRDLMKQYDRIEMDMSKATTSAQLGQLEHEGGLVVQEICLVAPRMHESMMQCSRQRRNSLAHGITESGFYIGKATPEQTKAIEKAIEEAEKEEKEQDVPEEPKKKTTKKSYKKKSAKTEESADEAK